MDNVVILGHDCLHWIKSKKRGREGVAALKLDLNKD